LNTGNSQVELFTIVIETFNFSDFNVQVLAISGSIELGIGHIEWLALVIASDVHGGQASFALGVLGVDNSDFSVEWLTSGILALKVEVLDVGHVSWGGGFDVEVLSIVVLALVVLALDFGSGGYVALTVFLIGTNDFSVFKIEIVHIVFDGVDLASTEVVGEVGLVGLEGFVVAEVRRQCKGAEDEGEDGY